MCCTFIPLGQLLQRLKLNFNGDRRGDNDSMSTVSCKIWTCLWVVFVASFVIALKWPEYTLIVFFLLPIYAIFIVIKSRYYMRSRYNIPSCCSRCKPKNECEGCCNDFCCVMWCLPCVLSQMLKHAHDEDKYVYTWYINTGLPQNAPEVPYHSIE